MRVFDASSAVYAWDNYPIDQFPSVWDWMEEQVHAREITVAKVAFDEIGNMAPDCSNWLSAAGILVLPAGNDILQESLTIKAVLGIQNNAFNPKGVDENDIISIATAKVKVVDLVSEEARQASLPNILAKYKIPAVCDLPSVQVHCINYIYFIRQSNEVFG